MSNSIVRRMRINSETKTKTEKEREVYAHYQQLGICTTCHKQPAMDDSTRCQDCTELRKSKYFQPRTEETSSKIEITPKERNEYVTNELLKNKILFKQINRSLYETSKGFKFLICTITIQRHGARSEPLYRIRNDNKIPCDFYVCLLPQDHSLYVIPNDNKSVIYFHIEEIEEYKNAFAQFLGTSK